MCSDDEDGYALLEKREGWQLLLLAARLVTTG
jgi:hypothetical protein